MKDFFKNENNFKLIIIGIFVIIVLIILKSQTSTQAQNMTVTGLSTLKKMNPYCEAYKKCSEIQMGDEFTNKCIELELEAYEYRNSNRR